MSVGFLADFLAALSAAIVALKAAGFVGLRP
jgi:hypothetical protein